MTADEAIARLQARLETWYDHRQRIRIRPAGIGVRVEVGNTVDCLIEWAPPISEQDLDLYASECYRLMDRHQGSGTRPREVVIDIGGSRNRDLSRRRRR